VYLVGYRDDIAVCGGGLKRLPDGACEIKRMYVVPDARGQGLARDLLRALEDAARDLGYTVARLDTGPRQQHAQRMYEAQGYVAVANFNANPVATFFGEKAL
jgi:GNAT superfamily N-acetyltransferase